MVPALLKPAPDENYGINRIRRLDTMGGAMVANLLKARFDVTGEAGVSFSGGRGKRQPTRSTPT
jgi:hypothetical protein